MTRHDRTVVVPIRTQSGDLIYVRASTASPSVMPESAAPVVGEVELAGRIPSMQDILQGIGNFTEELLDKIRTYKFGRMTIEMGCEFAVESGTLITVIGKASGKSSLKITLEWQRSEA